MIEYMEDVFDRTGRAPDGWMHAIFADGPFENDVGRCVPGPPAPDPLEIPLLEGETWIYRILSVLYADARQERDDFRVIYAAAIPEDSELEEWWSDRSGWK